MKSCSVLNCDKPFLARGYCSAHYNQWRKYGDPEHRQMARHGEPYAWLCEHVHYSDQECLIWPFKSRTVKGYGQTWFAGRLTGAHRVMCELVHGPAPTPLHETAHSCGNGRGGCVTPNHVRWATPVENAADKKLHGTDSIGEQNAQAKLRREQVMEIRRRADLGERHQRIAEAFGVSRRNVSMIAQRKTWGHIR